MASRESLPIIEPIGIPVSLINKSLDIYFPSKRHFKRFCAALFKELNPIARQIKRNIFALFQYQLSAKIISRKGIETLCFYEDEIPLLKEPNLTREGIPRYFKKQMLEFLARISSSLQKNKYKYPDAQLNLGIYVAGYYDTLTRSKEQKRFAENFRNYPVRSREDD